VQMFRSASETLRIFTSPGHLLAKFAARRGAKGPSLVRIREKKIPRDRQPPGRHYIDRSESLLWSKGSKPRATESAIHSIWPANRRAKASAFAVAQTF